MAKNHKETKPHQEHLMSRLREGDETAFRDLYLLYYNRLMHYGCSIEKDSNLVHDAIQELFVWLLQHRKQLHNIQNLDTYLFKSIRRNIGALASQERQAKLKAQTYELEKNNDTPSTEAKIIEEEQLLFKREWLKKQITRLPGHQQEVIFLRFYENFDYDDIAEIFSVSNQVIRNTVFRAMKNLRKNANLPNTAWLTGLLYLALQLFS